MAKINENFFNLSNNELFSAVREKMENYQAKNPNKKLIHLGVGDVSLPLAEAVVNAMKKACDEMADIRSFKGYGLEVGYEFLREKIAKEDYQKRGISISKEEIFISDGIKTDIGAMHDIFPISNKVAITDPVYPVYVDSNIIAGRHESNPKSENSNINNEIIYLPCKKENNFVPKLPEEKVDIIYLCYPNNPTGKALTKEELKKWVDYAQNYHSIILFDSAYEAYITDPNIPHSIYEIEGAEKVAIEFKSFSKTAGFTGVRCSYTVVPKALFGYTEKGEKVSIHALWNRRVYSKYNGVSYITQKGAEAVYTEEGKMQIQKQIAFYIENVKIMKQGLEKLGYEVYGGVNSPYVWLKTPQNQTSWQFFDYLLENAGIVGTPGVGFGKNGEGYFRLTGYGKKEETLEAIERLRKI